MKQIILLVFIFSLTSDVFAQPISLQTDRKQFDKLTKSYAIEILKDTTSDKSVHDKIKVPNYKYMGITWIMYVVFNSENKINKITVRTQDDVPIEEYRSFLSKYQKQYGASTRQKFSYVDFWRLDEYKLSLTFYDPEKSFGTLYITWENY